MSTPNDIYELPSTTSQDIRKMYVWLGGIFGGLLLIGLTVIFFAQTLVKFIPFSAEERFVAPYEKVFFQSKDTLSDEDKVIQSYLETLVERLDSVSTSTPDVTYKIHYSNKSVENAFATLGGHIVIYRGLLDSLENENALAMIIAHEMAHIKSRDPAAGAGRSLALSMIIASASGGYYDGVADLLSEAGISQFSRKQEKQADIIALDMLNALYGHVGGRDDFFRMMAKDETDIPTWLASHPDVSERISYLEKVSTDKGYVVGEKVLFPENIQAALSKNRF